ncbi:6-phosphogluconate dehydrogenase, decarboxylating [Trichonephila inaurata madagascariensis]|uniref:6-phosphogluconate dehydrogenase, decarboxylating n=1 Tax=Trichonephila inaurata madagascariensis TaxID=2747483 RepID=A0A8X7BP43_9ARAC|nr:6-phosphogluconate dehydrogenase, decarboxylating [Trichonephila inaurata madagascariensis]
MRCETYNNRIKRTEAWEEVARQLYSNYDEMELTKQTTILSELNKKWKNLRQCYKRELDSQYPKSGSAKKKKSQYIFFDTLSFLAPMFPSKATTSNTAVEEEEDDEVEGIEVGDESNVQEESSEETNQSLRSFAASAKKSCKRKREPEDPVADVCQFLKQSLEDKIAAEKRQKERDEMDDDRQFLMSLLNHTRAITERHKLDMRAEVLQIVTKYYNMSRCPQPEPFTTHSPPFQQPVHATFTHPPFSQSCMIPPFPVILFSPNPVAPSPNEMYHNEASAQCLPEIISSTSLQPSSPLPIIIKNEDTSQD